MDVQKILFLAVILYIIYSIPRHFRTGNLPGWQTGIHVKRLSAGPDRYSGCYKSPHLFIGPSLIRMTPRVGQNINC